MHICHVHILWVVLCMPLYWYIQKYSHETWWRHQMETLSALLAIGAGNSPVTCEFPTRTPVTRSFDVSLVRAWINGWVNCRVAGHFRRPLWRHYNEGKWMQTHHWQVITVTTPRLFWLFIDRMEGYENQTEKQTNRQTKETASRLLI